MVKISKTIIQKSFYKRALNYLEYQISLGESYIPVVKERLEDRNKRRLNDLLYKQDKRLTKLEALITPNAQKLEAENEKALVAYDKKDQLRRRAAKQTLKRTLAKEVNDATAQDNYDQRIALLDERRQAFIGQLDQKTAKPDDHAKIQAALLEKKEQLKQNASDVEDLRQKLEQDKTDRLARLTQTTEARLEKLIAKRNHYLEQMASINTAEKEANQAKLAQLKQQLADLSLEDPKYLEILHAHDHLQALENIQQEHSDIHLSLSHLTMRFGGLRAVDDLSFDVKKGEIFGLIGPNGAGKTTVFNCITRFYRATEGEIYYQSAKGDVLNLNDFKVHDVIKEGLVRTFQNVELIWELSVLDNMLVGAHTLYRSNFFTQLLHLPKLRKEEQIVRAKALNILENLGLLGYKDFVPLGLPYGVLKKIELARTLMTDPNLIILDEPAAGLNDAETANLAKTIKQIQKDYACTIFLVEHDMELVMDICDTICAISFGKKLAIGNPDEIQKNPIVREAYLGGE